MGSGGGSRARRCGLPRPLLPPPPPASARLIILLIDKQSGRGGDSRRAFVAKPWETRRARPGNSARAPGARTVQAAGPSRRVSGGGLARRPGSGARTGAVPAPLLRERCRVRGRRRPPHNGAAMAAAGAAVRGVRAAATAAAPAPSPFLTSLPLRAGARRAGGPRGGGRGIGAGGGAGAAAGPGRRARPAGDPAPRRVRVVSCRPKRQPKPSSDEGYWDCSVCTFRNSAEAFKCMMCDVRKGTSTR